MLLGIFVIAGCAPIGDPPKVIPDQKAKKELPETPQERMKAALDNVESRQLYTYHSFWTVIHGILGNGLNTTIYDKKTKKHIKAVEWIQSGKELRGLKFIPTPHGVDVRIGPQFSGQGHQDQFVGELAQCGVSLDAKFNLYGKEYTFEDFLNHAKMRAAVNKDQELSWTLVALSQYYGTDFQWTNDWGKKLTFKDLVRYELAQPIGIEAACGGTHRLFGLTWAYHIHLRNGGETNGVWAAVKEKLQKYQDMARRFQNPDGTFSTQYLSGPGNEKSDERRINTTGHVLEWLSISLTEKQLKEKWVRRGADALAKVILKHQGQILDAGGLYHASHGLRIYYERVYGEPGQGHLHLIPLPPNSPMSK